MTKAGVRLLFASFPIVLIGLGSCALSTSAPRKGPPLALDKSPEGQLASMVWLAGYWRGKTPKGVWEAHYTTPDGGMILGTSKEYIDGRVLAFEFERFALEGDTVSIWPQPRGRSSVSFALTKLDPARQRAVFENPQHDFPQRLEYWRKDNNTLVISISAPADEPGKHKGFQLVLERY